MHNLVTLYNDSRYRCRVFIWDIMYSSETWGHTRLLLLLLLRYWIAAYSVTTPGLYSCGPNTENTA